MGSSEKRDRQGYKGGGNSSTQLTQLHNNIDNYIVHLFSTRFQRALSTFRFIMLFELIKVPQMGGDSYYFHFIDEATEAQKGVK